MRLTPIPKARWALPLRGVAAVGLSALRCRQLGAWSPPRSPNWEERGDFHLIWRHFGIISRRGGQKLLDRAKPFSHLHLRRAADPDSECGSGRGPRRGDSGRRGAPGRCPGLLCDCPIRGEEKDSPTSKLALRASAETCTYVQSVTRTAAHVNPHRIRAVARHARPSGCVPVVLVA
jgi:hypothetical protein